MIYLAFLLLLLVSPVHAATLEWDAQPIDGPLTIERGTTPTGPFTAIATVPQGTLRYILTPGLWGHYRVISVAGPSNTVQYSLDLYSGGLTDRLDTLETRITVLGSTNVAQDTMLQSLATRMTVLESELSPVPPPAPTSTFTITHIDATHIRVTCNGVGITTLGSGTSRTMECRQ